MRQEIQVCRTSHDQTEISDQGNQPRDGVNKIVDLFEAGLACCEEIFTRLVNVVKLDLFFKGCCTCILRIIILRLMNRADACFCI